MKIFHFLKRWLTDGCVYYTAISCIFLLLNLFTGDASAIRTLTFVLMLPCGLVISLGTQLLRLQSIPAPLRSLSHYLCTILAIFLFLFLPSSQKPSATTSFLMLVFLSVLYWIAFLIVLLIKSRIRKKKN